jgi:hypothetical protein
MPSSSKGAGLDPPRRLALRQQLALPALAELHAWLLANQRTTAAGSGMVKAIDHALKRWPALQRYASSGSLPIDNNPVENAIRPIAIGRKNWLFAGSERAGRRAAAIQSLFTTTKLNGLDPARWLADTLEKLPERPNSKIEYTATARKLYTALNADERWGRWPLTMEQPVLSKQIRQAKQQFKRLSGCAWAFMPRCQSLPSFDGCISGSRLPSLF